MLIDTHCHLTDERLAGQIDEVLSRARAVGVTKIIAPSTSLEDARKVVEVVDKYDEVFGLVGIHPENVDLYRFPIGSGMTTINELSRLVKSSKKVVGIGEIGLDFHYDSQKSSKNKQVEIFFGQMELAVKLDLPVMVHLRDAEVEMREVLAQMKKLPRGQFHCFGESEEFLAYILDKGFFVSYCGNVTYKSAEHIRKLVIRTPIERLLLETDSPYLTPEPKRGSVNEPSNVKVLAEYMAKLLGIQTDSLINQTTKNAECLYSLG